MSPPARPRAAQPAHEGFVQLVLGVVSVSRRVLRTLQDWHSASTPDPALGATPPEARVVAGGEDATLGAFGDFVLGVVAFSLRVERLATGWDDGRAAVEKDANPPSSLRDILR